MAKRRTRRAKAATTEPGLAPWFLKLPKAQQQRLTEAGNRFIGQLRERQHAFRLGRAWAAGAASARDTTPPPSNQPATPAPPRGRRGPEPSVSGAEYQEHAPVQDGKALMSDGAVARRLGSRLERPVSDDAVRRARTALGIAPYQPPRR